MPRSVPFFSSKPLLLFLGCVLPAASALAQGSEPSGALPTEAARHKAAFARQVKARQLLRDPDWYYRYQVDVTKSQELKREGVDLALLDTRAGAGTYQENLLYTTTVVRGRIVGQQEDARPEVYFHSQYQVKVDEVLAGPVPAGVLTVCLRSGPVNKVFLHSSDEPRLAKGEQVILYLNPINKRELAEAKTQGTWNFTDNSKAGDFTLVEKYVVKNRYVFDADGTRLGKTSAVAATIQRVAAVFDKPNFATKSFD